MPRTYPARKQKWKNGLPAPSPRWDLAACAAAIVLACIAAAALLIRAGAIRQGPPSGSGIPCACACTEDGCPARAMDSGMDEAEPAMKGDRTQ